MDLQAKDTIIILKPIVQSKGILIKKVTKFLYTFQLE